MTPNEEQLCEAFKLMLESSIELGLPKNDQEDHSAQYLHEHIGEQFRSKTTDLVHYDSVSAAFEKVHGYKLIGDPTFWRAMERELQSMAVPVEEQTKVQGIVESLAKEHNDEASAGYNPQIDEITELYK